MFVDVHFSEDAEHGCPEDADFGDWVLVKINWEVNRGGMGTNDCAGNDLEVVSRRSWEEESIQAVHPLWPRDIEAQRSDMEAYSQ